MNDTWAGGGAGTPAAPTAISTAQGELLRRSWFDVLWTLVPEGNGLAQLVDERLGVLEAAGRLDEPSLLQLVDEVCGTAQAVVASDVVRTLRKRLGRAIYEFLLAQDAMSPTEQAALNAPAGLVTMAPARPTRPPTPVAPPPPVVAVAPPPEPPPVAAVAPPPPPAAELPPPPPVVVAEPPPAAAPVDEEQMRVPVSFRRDDGAPESDTPAPRPRRRQPSFAEALSQAVAAPPTPAGPDAGEAARDGATVDEALQAEDEPLEQPVVAGVDLEPPASAEDARKDTAAIAEVDAWDEQPEPVAAAEDGVSLEPGEDAADAELAGVPSAEFHESVAGSAPEDQPEERAAAEEHVAGGDIPAEAASAPAADPVPTADAWPPATPEPGWPLAAPEPVWSHAEPPIAPQVPSFFTTPPAAPEPLTWGQPAPSQGLPPVQDAPPAPWTPPQTAPAPPGADPYPPPALPPAPAADPFRAAAPAPAPVADPFRLPPAPAAVPPPAAPGEPWWPAPMVSGSQTAPAPFSAPPDLAAAPPPSMPVAPPPPAPGSHSPDPAWTAADEGVSTIPLPGGDLSDSFHLTDPASVLNSPGAMRSSGKTPAISGLEGVEITPGSNQVVLPPGMTLEDLLQRVAAESRGGARGGSWGVRVSPRQQQLQQRMAEKRRQESERAAYDAAVRSVDLRATGRRRSKDDRPLPEVEQARTEIDELLRRKKGGESAALLQRMAQERGGREIADLSMDIGDRCRALGLRQAATNCYLAAWRSDPIYETPLWRLSDVCIDDKDPEMAVSYLERIAELMRGRGDDEGALGVYRKITALVPQRRDIRDLIARARATGRLD